MVSELKYTPLEEIETIRTELKAGFNTGKLKPIAYRKYLLLQLAYAIKDNTSRWEDALLQDLGRPKLEGALLEVGALISEIMDAYNNVEKWAATEKAPFNTMWFPMNPVIRKEPKGVVLIIGPFNYPLSCLLGPLAGAIAAGNATLLKPSEQVPTVAALVTEILPQYLDSDVVRIVNGGIPEMTKILDLQWDHIMFTGSGRIGRVVATAAARHLTPTTLELGGKSPTIIDPNCNLYSSVKRIWFGKFVNGGQSCVAPDYILVPKDFMDTLVDMIKKVYAEFYPPDAPVSQANTGHLISHGAFKRVSSLISQTKGKIIIGGLDHADESTNYIPPTVVRDVDPNDVLMEEEIFGPVLPIVGIDKLEDAIPFVNARPHPLALYVHSRNTSFIETVFSKTQSGSAVANDANIHYGTPGLPFGGTGASGYGANTGKASFDSFTHLRGSLNSPSWVDKIFYYRFPPYSDKKLKTVRKEFYKSLPKRPSGPPVGAASASTSFPNKWLILLLAAVLLTSQGRAGLLTLWSRLKDVKGFISGI